MAIREEVSQFRQALDDLDSRASQLETLPIAVEELGAQIQALLETQAQLAAGVEQVSRLLSAPKKVMRDEAGRVVGIQPDIAQQ